MVDPRVVEQEAARRAAALPLGEVIGRLVAVFDAALVCVVAGEREERTLIRWTKGLGCPSATQEKTLRLAHQVMEMLLACEDAGTAGLWMEGANEHLEGEAPALVLATRPEAVLHAARAALQPWQ